MKQFRYLFVILAAAMLAACNSEAPYSLSPDTVVNIDVLQVSAGYAEVEFSTDRDAYYLASFEKVDPEVDPMKIQKQYMQLALDYAYMEYINWRYNLLSQGLPMHQIATFKDHSLGYGTLRGFAHFLDPNTDYWVYAFAVNPKENKPVSSLYIKKIHTEPFSKVECRFRYRIKDTWDYVYPVNPKGEIINDFPYAGAIMDSLTVRRRVQGWSEDKQNPGSFFADSLASLIADRVEDERIKTGVLARNNRAGYDGHDFEFEEGVTYYAAFAGVDGGLRPGQNSIYRFVWHQNMDVVFEPDQTIGYNWD